MVVSVAPAITERTSLRMMEFLPMESPNHNRLTRTMTRFVALANRGKG
jgi:hypothetical protein